MLFERQSNINITAKAGVNYQFEVNAPMPMFTGFLMFKKRQAPDGENIISVNK